MLYTPQGKLLITIKGPKEDIVYELEATDITIESNFHSTLEKEMYGVSTASLRATVLSGNMIVKDNRTQIETSHRLLEVL